MFLGLLRRRHPEPQRKRRVLKERIEQLFTQIAFSLISGHSEITFAHRNGFLAKTKERLAIDDLIALVSKAVVGY
jgi:hypothetical protein